MGPEEKTVDLNADLGEGFPWDEALLAHVSSANICCGAHAGDPEAIARTLRAAKARGVAVGAHPGYADRPQFGRKELDLPSSEIRALLEEQINGLAELAAREGLALRFVKPHGALYNQAMRDARLADDLVSVCLAHGLPVVGQPGSSVEENSRKAGLRFIAEGFADRRYQPDGRLVARSALNALLDDPGEIRGQVLRLVEQGIETLCLHGDNPRALGLAAIVVQALKCAGVSVRSCA
jgi:UPF0271 protein